MPITFSVAFVGLLAALSQLVLFCTLHFVSNRYNPIRNAESDYGVGPTKAMFRLYLWLNNVATLAMVAVFYIDASMFHIPERSMLYMVILIFARLGIAFFPTDLEGSKTTVTGVAHYVFAVIAFTMMYLIIMQLTPLLVSNTDWQPVKGILANLAAITTPALAVVCLTVWKPTRKVFGLVERIYILTATLWFLTVSAFLVYLLR